MPSHPSSINLFTPIGIQYRGGLPDCITTSFRDPITEVRPRSSGSEQLSIEALLEEEARAILRDRERGIEQLSLEEVRALTGRGDEGFVLFPPSPFASPVVKVGLAVALGLGLWLLAR